MRALPAQAPPRCLLLVVRVPRHRRKLARQRSWVAKLVAMHWAVMLSSEVVPRSTVAVAVCAFQAAVRAAGPPATPRSPLPTPRPRLEPLRLVLVLHPRLLATPNWLQAAATRKLAAWWWRRVPLHPLAQAPWRCEQAALQRVLVATLQFLLAQARLVAMSLLPQAQQRRVGKAVASAFSLATRPRALQAACGLASAALPARAPRLLSHRQLVAWRVVWTSRLRLASTLLEAA